MRRGSAEEHHGAFLDIKARSRLGSWRKPERRLLDRIRIQPAALGSCDPLVLQDPDYDTTVFGLSLFGRIGIDLAAGAHRPRRKHIG